MKVVKYQEGKLVTLTNGKQVYVRNVDQKKGSYLCASGVSATMEIRPSASLTFTEELAVKGYCKENNWTFG